MSYIFTFLAGSQFALMLTHAIQGRAWAAVISSIFCAACAFIAAVFVFGKQEQGNGG